MLKAEITKVGRPSSGQRKGGIDLDGATNADIDFIANARQDIPFLIGEIERLVDLLEHHAPDGE
jgi:hypothetical protein